MFFPGETITHIFYIPFAVNEVDHVIVSYKQNGAIMFEKTVTSGFEQDSQNVTKVSYQLTQDESLLFEDEMSFTIQCNVYTLGGTRHVSHEMNSSSGIQYFRDIMDLQPLRIVTQPVDCYVESIGDTATFKIVAQSAIKYQWQYQVNDGEWKNASNGKSDVYQIEATEERISTHKYRCVISSYTFDTLTSDVVKILYTDRSDE